MEYGILSLAIPLLTIILAIITKDVVVSILGGIFLGELVLHRYDFIDAFFALFDGIIALLSEGWIAKTVVFILLVGAIIKLLSDSGAVERFVLWIDSRAKYIDSPKGAMMLAYIVGVVIFIESSITSLIAGTVSKPLCDRNGVSRAKLAYICDSTSAPICSLIPLNAWGALLLGLIATAIESKVIEGSAIELLIASIPFNFYSLITLAIVLVVIYRGWDIGPMRDARSVPYHLTLHTSTLKPSLYPMLIPVLIMVAAVPMMLYYTGKGDIFAGSGSTSVYYATIITMLIIYLYYVGAKYMSHKAYINSSYRGMGEMIQLVLIIILALLIGNVIKDLGTAKFLAETVRTLHIPAMTIPMMIFLVASLIAFATGTSWGTFSIMMPIALAMGGMMDLSLPLMIGAVVSGGIFGDHSSPISDTTIIASMAAECDHIEHVRTQLPYALIGGGIAAVAFLIAGWATA